MCGARYVNIQSTNTAFDSKQETSYDRKCFTGGREPNPNPQGWAQPNSK
jgi:hypothetical protein